jgi:Effector protein
MHESSHKPKLDRPQSSVGNINNFPTRSFGIEQQVAAESPATKETQESSLQRDDFNFDATKIPVYNPHQASSTYAHSSFFVQTQLIQKEGDTPGYGICTEFGDYWVVPDNTNMSYNVEGEQITQSEFTQLQNTWNALKSGSGKVTVTEKDSTGKAHNGFKDKIIGNLGKLLSKPTGRRLIIGLINGSQTVTIRPSSDQIYGGANAIRGGAGTLENSNGTAGTGGTTIIQVDPGVADDSIKVYDVSGKEIADPIFIFLGHELIHAQHNEAGRNRRNLPASSNAYSNKEEEETIATGAPSFTNPITENSLRDEHGLPKRHGHGGRDTR